MNLSGNLNHPKRLLLASEIHARPFMVIEAPAKISHLAIFRDDGQLSHETLLQTLCARFGVAAPGKGAQHFAHDFGHFRLKWERHTEFSTFSFVELGDSGGDFEQTAIRDVPSDWLESLRSSVIVASHIIAERGASLPISDRRLKRLFPLPPLVGSQVLSDGEIWTDFQVGPDGFSRYLIRDIDLRESQMGRLVQRICEIETYLMMALLALPLAREAGALLGRIEEDLITLADKMSRHGVDENAEEQLNELSRLDSMVRAMSFRTGFRFSAAQAYYSLVEARIGELRERRIEGVPTIGEFMERRLAPAINSCKSASVRQEVLAKKISSSDDMLRTRVNLAQERQNQNVLKNLSLSVSLQLRLQQAVEGLSVVAISYYAIGLVGYLLKALKDWGLGIHVDSSIGLAMPIVLLAVWLSLRRLHKHIALRSTGTL